MLEQKHEHEDFDVTGGIEKKNLFQNDNDAICNKNITDQNINNNNTTSSNSTTTTAATVSYCPIYLHPVRPTIVWAVDAYLFGLNLKSCEYECFRLKDNEAPITSIDLYSLDTIHDQSDASNNFWIISSADKTISVLNDATFSIKERFLLRKKPTAVLIGPYGKSVFLGDKFGDLFRFSYVDLRYYTQKNLISIIDHLKHNKADKSARQEYFSILEKFLPHIDIQDFLLSFKMNNNTELQQSNIIKREYNQTELNDSERALLSSSYNNSCHDDDDDSENHVSNKIISDKPFACHLAGITAVSMSSDQQQLVSADRDEKLRVCRCDTPVITTGYGLGHTEFITALCCPKNHPDLVASIAGDQTFRLWDISAGMNPINIHNIEGCVEIGCIKLNNVPSSIKFIQHHNSLGGTFLIVCESLSGILCIPIHKDDRNNNNQHNNWKIENSAVYTISLPSRPVAIEPIYFTQENANDYEKLLQHTKAIQENIHRFGYDQCFFWVDLDGHLRLPISLLSKGNIHAGSIETDDCLSNNSIKWIGEETGSPFNVVTLNLWKHNRVPNAATDIERREKRRRGQQTLLIE